MRTGSLFFLLGILALMQLPALPPLYLLFLSPLCVLVMWRSPWVSWLAWILCGFLWMLFRADLIISKELDSHIEGNPVMVEGRIIELPEYRNTSIRFNFYIEKLIDARGVSWPSPGKVRLSWYRNFQELEVGESWRLKVKLKRPYGFINPGGFDYEAWLFQNGIRATGYVLGTGLNIRLAAAEGSTINRLRFHLRQKLVRLVEGEFSAPLIQALVIGDRSAITPQQWQVLTNTGTNHLLAISGLHIGFIAGLVFFITRWLWPFIGAFISGVAAPRVAAVSAIITAALYAALAGFSVPTVRALTMLSIVLLLVIFYRRTATSNLLALALLVVLILNPFAVLSPGFWLSFLAIVVIVYGMAYRLETHGLWWRWGRVQYLVALGLAPLLILWFQQVPLLSIAANCIAVPWVSLVSVPLVLGGSILSLISETLGGIVINMGANSLDLIWPVLEFIASVKASILYVAMPSLIVLIAAFIGVALLLMPKGLPGHWLGVIWMLPLLYADADFPEIGDFKLTLLDVGQGLAVLVQTSNHILLYDTGPKYSERFNAGSGVILPYLRHSSITKIDVLIQGHGDSDHMGGLDDVLNRFPVSKILTSVPESITNPQVKSCKRGQSWQWDGVKFEMLHPSEQSRFRGNNGSCVLRISQKKYSVLVTGDIERIVEQRLVSRDPDKLAASVLIAPHHGSGTSSTSAFIEAVDPDYVLFPVGYRNRFGFPKQDIIDRYRNHGIKMLDTASSGAIEIRIQNEEMKVVKHRHNLRRFWHTLH